MKKYIQPRAMQISLIAEDSVLNAVSAVSMEGDVDEVVEDDFNWSNKKEGSYGFGPCDWE